ncbi:MAG: hypothetical protein ABR987_12575 [Terracidiphilus sp.]
MKTRLLAASLCVFWSITAAAQVTGEFYLEKAAFARGEPVFLYFKISNQGPNTIQILAPYLGQPACSGVIIHVAGSSTSPSSCPDLKTNSCTLNGPMGQAIPLPPGQSHVDRFLLNFGYEIDDQDDYRVTATHAGFPFLTFGDAHAELSFRVDGDASAYPAGKLQEWVGQLKSLEQDKRLEAALTLASVAPVSLQSTLLGFADNAELRSFAPLASHRLNTPESLQAMADLVKTAGPGTWEQMESARYLAGTNDLRWLPLLLDAAEKNAGISQYVAYAAELGGERTLTELVTLAKIPDHRMQALMAMGSTRSGQAIPILLDYLKSPDAATRERAVYGLRLLTHRSSGPDAANQDPQAAFRAWSQWWQREGATAPVYKDSECGLADPLPLAP